MGHNATEEIRAGLIHYPVKALGPGIRVGVWVQGCDTRCKGCISAHTWNMDAVIPRTVGEVIDEILSFGCEPLRVTISGGEPFLQPEALHSLISGLRERGADDILVYSGYLVEDIGQRFPHTLELIDALVDGPFMEGQETESLWKGSQNQGMWINADSPHRNAYAEYKDKSKAEGCLQVVKSGGELVVVGIPRQKDVKEIMYGAG